MQPSDISQTKLLIDDNLNDDEYYCYSVVAQHFLGRSSHSSIICGKPQPLFNWQIDIDDGNPITPKMTGGIGKVLDLSKRFDLEKKFDYVISVEVAEHIPKEYEDYETILGEPLYVNQFRFSKFIKKNFLTMLKKPTLFFDKNKRNLRFHFDMMHGKGNLSKAIMLLDDSEKKDFELISYSTNDRNDNYSSQFRSLFLNRFDSCIYLRTICVVL